MMCNNKDQNNIPASSEYRGVYWTTGYSVKVPIHSNFVKCRSIFKVIAPQTHQLICKRVIIKYLATT